MILKSVENCVNLKDAIFKTCWSQSVLICHHHHSHFKISEEKSEPFYSCANVTQTISFTSKSPTIINCRVIFLSVFYMEILSLNLSMMSHPRQTVWNYKFDCHITVQSLKEVNLWFCFPCCFKCTIFSHLRATSYLSSLFLPLREVAQIDVGLHALQTAGFHAKLKCGVTHLDFLCFLKKIWWYADWLLRTTSLCFKEYFWQITFAFLFLLNYDHHINPARYDF